MIRVRGEQGTAAVELALVFAVLVALLALVVPLSLLFYERLQLSRAAGDVVRFASSRSDADRTVEVTDTAGGTRTSVVPADTLPDHDAAGRRVANPEQVLAEAHRAYGGAGTLLSATTTEKVETADADDPRFCPTTRRLTVVLTSSVDLGPFAGLLVSGTTDTLVARATSCEE